MGDADHERRVLLLYRLFRFLMRVFNVAISTDLQAALDKAEASKSAADQAAQARAVTAAAVKTAQDADTQAQAALTTAQQQALADATAALDAVKKEFGIS